MLQKWWISCQLENAYRSSWCNFGTGTEECLTPCFSYCQSSQQTSYCRLNWFQVKKSSLSLISLPRYSPTSSLPPTSLFPACLFPLLLYHLLPLPSPLSLLHPPPSSVVLLVSLIPFPTSNLTYPLPSPSLFSHSSCNALFSLAYSLSFLPPLPLFSDEALDAFAFRAPLLQTIENVGYGWRFILNIFSAQCSLPSPLGL